MDKKIVFLFLFLSAAGAACGCFFELFLSGSGKEQLISILSGSFNSTDSGLSPWSSFWQNLCSGLFFLFLCFFSPKLLLLFPIGGLILFLRGMALGFSASMILEALGCGGMRYISLTLAPAGIMQILLYSCMLSLAAEQRRRIRGKRKTLRILTGSYLHSYAAGLVILIFICLLQSVLILTVT